MSEDLVDNLKAMDLTTKPPEDSIEGKEDVVDPWNVASGSDKGIDYDKLISNALIQ